MILKVILLAVFSCLIALSFGKQSTFSKMIAIAAAVLTASLIIGLLSTIVEDMTWYYTYTNLDFAYLKVMLKGVAVAFLSRFGAGICEDSGYQSLSSYIILAGKIIILSLSLPILKEAFRLCIHLVTQ